MANANLPSFFADVKTSKAILDLLKWDKIKAKDPNDKINCVARMEYNKKTYWAVNGAPKNVNNPQTNAERIETLNSILKDRFKNHIVVHLSTTTTKIDSPDVTIDPMIYFPSKGTVSLTTYQNACKNSSPPIKEITVRLFSCCERKLIAAVTKPKKDHFQIDVIKPPCELCLAAKKYLNNPYFKLNYANILLVEAYDELHSLGLV